MKTEIDQIPVAKRVLMTGGTGLIGNRQHELLTTEGYLTTILTRPARQATHPQHQYVQWDGRHIDPDLGPQGTVINLAGAGIADHRWTPSYKKLILESRVNATRACAQWIGSQAIKPRVFLSASAVGFYPTNTAKALTEDSPPGTDFLARTGIAWEAAAQGAGIRTVLLRTGVVFAPEGGAFPRLLTPFKFYAGGYVGTGNQPFPWVHIEDVVGLFRFALENEQVSGPLNVVAPDLKTNKQVAHAVGRLIGKPSGLPVPAFAVKAIMGESATILLDGQRVEPKRATDWGYVFTFPKLDSALQHLLNPDIRR